MTGKQSQALMLWAGLSIHVLAAVVLIWVRYSRRGKPFVTWFLPCTNLPVEWRRLLYAGIVFTDAVLTAIGTQKRLESETAKVEDHNQFLLDVFVTILSQQLVQSAFDAALSAVKHLKHEHDSARASDVATYFLLVLISTLTSVLLFYRMWAQIRVVSIEDSTAILLGEAGFALVTIGAALTLLGYASLSVAADNGDFPFDYSVHSTFWYCLIMLFYFSGRLCFVLAFLNKKYGDAI